MSESKSKLLILIDANALLHRAFHALPPLTTAKGELVNAVYGFTSVLLKVFDELKPDYVLCAFDKKAPTFRHKLFKEYKATRQKAPQELYKQIPRIKQVLDVFDIPTYEMAGYEADDIIGALSKKAGINNIIVTGDMDALQLVDQDTKVYTLRKGVQDTVVYDEPGVKERYGFKPDQLVDFKALRGDPSDNIPGVAGIGEKTATDLIKEFGNIDNLYKNIESPKIKDRYRKLLKEDKDKAFLSKKLAKIVCDIPFKIDWKKAKLKRYNRDKVIKLFQELEFRSLIKRLPETAVSKQTNLFEKKEAKKYHFIKTKKELNDLLDKLNKLTGFVFYLENDDLAFALSSEEIYYLPISYLDRLKPIFENEKIEKYGYHLKRSFTELAKKKINLANIKFDIMLASYLLNPTGNFDLEDIAFREFGIEMAELKKEELVCFKAGLIFKIKTKLEKKLGLNEKMQELFQDIEMPLIKVLAKMEIAGIKIDLPHLKKLSQDFKKNISVLEKEIHRLAGIKFNISSPKQLSVILFAKLKLPTQDIKRTTTGFSTGALELAKLRKKHPIISLAEQYRELTKLKTTYLDTLPKLADSKNRVHTTFHQTGTVTGRLSSSDPNLQNIPIRTEIGRKIRKAFIVEKGYKLLSADYSQIDLRILAHVSKDQEMLTAFQEDKDIHARTASEIFGVAIKKVTPEMRRVAKTINFGLVYGMSPFGLSRTLGIEPEKAKQYIDKYFAKHIGIAMNIKETLEEARETGYVETLLGRRRYLPELISGSPQVRASTERMAINMPIQGCLPATTRVLTSKGYKPIGKLHQLSKKERPKFVWDGTRWKKYHVLDRGPEKLAQIHLADGKILRCDVRHKVLTVDDQDYHWAHFNDLRPGIKVCETMPQILHFANPPQFTFRHTSTNPNGRDFQLSYLNSNFYYWLGYYFGDGSFYKRKGKKTKNTYALSFVFGKENKERAFACAKFFKKLDLNPLIRQMPVTSSRFSSYKWEVAILSQGLGYCLKKIGIIPNATAKNKRLPSRIFGETIKHRLAFLRGIFDSDGCYYENLSDGVPQIHLCQRELLEDIHLLFLTLGAQSSIRGPYTYHKLISWRLDIPRRQLYSLFKKRVSTHYSKNNITTPLFLIEHFLKKYPKLPKKFFKNASDHVIYYRWRHGGTSSLIYFVHFLKKYNLSLNVPIYSWSKVRKTKRLNQYERTYTLSVEKTHRFDSEGVISKNTTADIIKIAMNKINYQLSIIDYQLRMLLQVHDELLFEIKEDKVKEYAKQIKEIMENIYKLDVPLKVDIKTGDNWQEMKKI